MSIYILDKIQFVLNGLIINDIRKHALRPVDLWKYKATIFRLVWIRGLLVQISNLQFLWLLKYSGDNAGIGNVTKQN